MCGICAVLGEDSEYLVKEMARILKHRGPDDEGFYSGQNVALGHRALFTGDSSKVRQPLPNEDETIWITFDGEIYNSRQLKKNLEKNHEFRSSSAAELVTHAYEEEGPNCVREFNGDFAFCLWDTGKRLLFSARDKIGIKPLYYYSSDPNRFLIASEIKALLADPSVPRKPNQRVIYQYIINGPRSHTGDTFLIGIKELLPAHYSLANQKGVEIQRYWNPVQSSGTSLLENDQVYASRFRELLQDSVKIRIPAESTFGTFLSGGLDSTSVACLIDNVLKLDFSADSKTRRQELFSAAYPDTEADETAYAKQVAQALEAKINYTFPHVSEQWNDVKKFVYYMDEPVPVFNYYVYWCLSKAASRKVRVTFSGQGPDEFLGGHGDARIAYCKELWRRKRIARLLRELVGSLGQYDFASIMTQVLSRDAKSGTKRLLESNLGKTFSEGKVESTIERLPAPKSAEDDIANKMQENDGSFDEFLLREVTETLSLDHLQFGDRASSAFSIEVRYPFLDYRIVEFAFRLPANQKIGNGWTKYILRNAMKGIIPEAIRKRRRKLGTPVPLEKWLIDLREKIEAVFKSRKFRERGYFNQPAVLDIYDRFCNGKMRRLEKTLYPDVLWRILNLELWFESFIDSPDGS